MDKQGRVQTKQKMKHSTFFVDNRLTHEPYSLWQN